MKKPDDKPTIIIRRIKRGGGAHHGGAWKIAYADFVTAMMAFFLLMWLLGSTTKGELQGIADYFNTPLKVALAGGSGSGDSSSLVKGGGQDLTRTFGQKSRTDRPERKRTVNLQAAAGEHKEIAQLNELKSGLEKMIADNPGFAGLAGQVRVDITSEGLRIQILDEQNRPMFDTGAARLKDYARDLLREIARTLNDTENRISLSGHTDARPYAGGVRGYSNWELSADRANAARRELIAGGIHENKIVRVVGLADSMHLVKDDPLDPSNRRISIVVMTKKAEQQALGESPAAKRQ